MTAGTGRILRLSPFSPKPYRGATLKKKARLAGPIHGGSSVESGLEPGTLWPQSRDLTTRPPRPPGLFLDGPLNFESRSDDKGDIWALDDIPVGGRLATCV
ncbi:hypothetical protein AVEN_95172-1 [Araneus ventricosus]|uniref:Uncharacterized protein n=1 Tax=Araneus ventricosus TaxID=182803 RepID=A0A4Y2SCK8_ARAVE|nr:hypothetical protein AVEN_57341-1 [Araneus ventricosus]GBN85797.1 hypothetical protein AVEN_95172-1 [Araneus ventricosus]